MLNSADMKFQMLVSKHIKKFSFFYAQISIECYFLLINVKMPTSVGILTFMGRKNFMLSRVEHEILFITLGPGDNESFVQWNHVNG